MVKLRGLTYKKMGKGTSHFYSFYKNTYCDFITYMVENQGENLLKCSTVSEVNVNIGTPITTFVDIVPAKDSKLGKELNEQIAPKKDLSRKAALYIQKHIRFKTLDRFESCHSWMNHLTNLDMSARKVYQTNSCGNRFCPICTWNTTKKDAVKISIMVDAVREIEDKEFLFLTLTAPSVSGAELFDQIDNFNKAIDRLFKRRNVERVVKGYIRKLEVTTDQEKYVTEKLYKAKDKYYDIRGIKVGDPNPTYDTYHPHVHIILVVNKSYFTDVKVFISQKEWLEMWRGCMRDNSITQVDAKKVRSTAATNSNAVLEIAKYTAKGSDLYHSELVFDTFYKALKRRHLLSYSGMMRDYARKFENGDLDRFKAVDDAEYTHMLRTIWKNSKYESGMRKLTVEEYGEFNKHAEFIEENDEME